MSVTDPVPDLVLAEGIFSDTTVEETHLAGRATVRLAQIGLSEEVSLATADADALVVTTHRLTREHVMALGPRVQVVGRAGVGLDALDLEAFRERGIAVVNTPAYATGEVATHAIALLLGLQRKLVESDATAREGWTQWDRLAPIRPLEELTLGLVGCGRIGEALVQRAAALVGRILVYDPGPIETPSCASRLDSLSELLASSDIVSLHLPLTGATAGIIGTPELDRMKQGALLVNVARGGLIDEGALAKALWSGHLGGAALDVLAEEPPSLDAEILAAPRTLLSPHTAWYSTASERRVRTQAVDGVLAILEGRSPEPANLVVPAST